MSNFLLYIHEDYGSGILNVIETKQKTLKHNEKSLGGANKTTHFGHLFIKGMVHLTNNVASKCAE